MEIVVETERATTSATLEIRLLGPVAVLRGGVAVALPHSRKLRALLAILIVEGRPLSRRRLCDLLWDRPNDPRAELRWHLSKLRHIIDDPDHRRLISGDDEIGIDLDGCTVDALQVLSAAEGAPELTPEASPESTSEPSSLTIAQLGGLSDLFRGPFLGEIDLAGPQAALWLTAQRRRFSGCELTLLRQRITAMPPTSDAFGPALERWLDLAPFDEAAHGALLNHLNQCGRVAEAEAHVAAAERLFVDEAVPVDVLRALWTEIRQRPRPATVTPSLPDPAPKALVVAEAGADAKPAAFLVAPNDTQPAPARRSALAVMPFRVAADGPASHGLATGLTRDVITRMAKLRSLSIIAHGSVEALAAQGLSDAEAGRQLDVAYVTSGVLRHTADRIVIEIDLIETATARLVWTEVCDAPADDVLAAMDALGHRIVAALTGEIEQAERNRAILRPPSSLDAWGAHHRGMWHMYRFTRADNAQAMQFFRQAVTLDPTFSRAHAGLSFTHWQNAFQNWSDHTTETERAYAAAAQSLQADEHDPAAHWAMGRALWLRQQHDAAVLALRQSVDLSPNFALGHYSLAFVEAQTGDPLNAIRASDTSRALSPFDPLMFGMLGCRAIAHLRLGQFDDAANWALRAVARPNAHVNILGIAALCLSLADRVPEGQSITATIHATQPGYDIDAFLSSFHFSPDEARLLRSASARVSMA